MFSIIVYLLHVRTYVSGTDHMFYDEAEPSQSDYAVYKPPTKQYEREHLKKSASGKYWPHTTPCSVREKSSATLPIEP